MQRNMVRLDGGTFTMGSEKFYAEEGPQRRVRVDPFWIDETPVTNAQFAEFVSATGHISFAEIAPDPKDYPNMPPELAYAGSAVFEMNAGPVDAPYPHWWHFVIGASWRAPFGPDSNLDALADHPVVHIAHSDALAYAAWAGKTLPSEAEWEFAARGGLDDTDYAWGDELNPDGQYLANYWQGNFPSANDLNDGWLRTSPVRHYPPNGYGLYDMIGNVWEWTEDWYALPKTDKKKAGSCCVPANPRGGTRGGSISRADPARTPHKVMKGGSHLCAENYCRRYRPAARYSQPIDTTTSHVGFRCILRA